MNPVTDRAAMFAQLRAGMAELGLAAEAATVDALLDYLELLTRWNSAYNLTSIRVPEQMVTHHLPGIPLAVLNPEREVTLIDANGKKTRFLREAVRTLKLGNVRIEACRVEDARGEYDTVTARAFASLGDMLHSAGHLLAPDGIVLALKGQLQRDEISALPDGFALGDVHALRVPGLAAARHAVIIRRTQAVRHGHAA